jgi:hypothetical protein
MRQRRAADTPISLDVIHIERDGHGYARRAEPQWRNDEVRACLSVDLLWSGATLPYRTAPGHLR